MAERTPVSLRFDDFELDEAEARLLRAGRPVALAPKAFALLCALARQPGQLLTKDALLDATWGHRHVSESVLKTTVSQLRAALGDDARQPRYVETASRHGYRFVGTPGGGPDFARAVLPTSPEVPAPIGRAVTLARLHAAWDAAATGQRSVVWLAGEAGIGKTTLIEHFAAGCGERIAHGQCVQQFGGGEPYLPVLEALAGLCRRDPALVTLLRSVAPTWLLQLPWLSSEGERATLQQQLAGVHPDRMLREGGELLDRYTQERPLLLVTEDLHWSDEATVRLLDHVARRRGPARLLWLGSFRPAELIAEGHPLKGLRHELRVQRRSEEIALEPFSERELADYLAQRVPGSALAATESLVRSLHAHTDGLPLFVASVVDELQAQGRLDEAAALHFEQVPETLAGIVERQLERLPPPQQALLEAAAVHGVEFRAAAVAAALERDAREVHDDCEALARRGQWLRTAAAGFVFRHALVRHAVVRRVGSAARTRWHGRIAQALEALRDAGEAVAAAELALHSERGQRPLEALRHHADAARSALGRFAPAEAERITAHALTLLGAAPPGPARLEAELALVSQRGVACSLLRTFSADAAKQAFERALELCELLPPTPQRAWAQGALGWVLYSRADYAGALALARRIEDAGDDAEAAARRVCACNLVGVTLAQQGDWVGAIDWLERGLALCSTLGDALPLARFAIDPRVSLRSLLGLAVLLLDEEARAFALGDEAIAIAQTTQQPSSMLMALWCAGMLAQRVEKLDRLRGHVQALTRLNQELGLGAAEGPALWMGGWLKLREGDAQGGLALIRAGIDYHRRSSRLAGLTHVMSGAAEALLALGDVEAARAQVEEALRLERQIGERASHADLLLLQGRVDAAAGRPEAAAAAFDAAEADARARRATLLEAVVRRVRAQTAC